MVRTALRIWRRLRVFAFVARLRARARAVGARIVVRVHPSARIDPGTWVTIAPGVSGALHVGAEAHVQRHVTIHLRGGEVILGPRCEIRPGVAVHAVAGRLDVGREVLLSYRVVVHCDAGIRIGANTIIGEHSTLTDSRHHHEGDDPRVYHNISVDPIEIGSNCWLAASVTVTMGTSIGDHCTVAAHSVVRGVVPAGSLVAGLPGRVIGRAT